jgi:NAD(P)H-hydrate epimerase
MADTITADQVRSLLPTRPADAHKYTFGKLLVVAGSPQYPGAATLATAGAARIGAGLVVLATGRSAASGPGRLAEITYTFLPEAEWGSLGEAAADELLSKLEGYQALLIGPGIGREQPTRRFLERLLGLDSSQQKNQKGRIGFQIGASDTNAANNRPELPACVLDADALSLLAAPPTAEARKRRGDFFQRISDEKASTSEAADQWWEALPRGRFVLTPHAGEMARLLGVEQIEGDPAELASAAAQRWGQIVVLKGATTVVASPDGAVALHASPNPALATAGTGDVLAGAIAGLIAQGLQPFDAAIVGVYLHSAAGHLLAEELGDTGTLASDLLPRLPLVIRALRKE